MGSLNHSFKSELSNYPLSIYPTNVSMDWCGTDTEDTWKWNLKNKSDSIDLPYYRKNPFQYKFNNYGYRTPYNFKEGDSVNIYLGCSHTVGIGLPIEETWGYLLHQKLNTTNKFVNLAQGGCGIENQFRLLYIWKDYFKIQNIFHFQPIYAREEFFRNGNNTNLLVQNEHLHPSITNHTDRNWFITTFGDETHILRKYITNILAIRTIANELGINYFYSYEFPLKQKEDIRQARDLAHIDTQQHKDLSMRYYTMLTNKDTSIDIIDSDEKVAKNLL